MDKGLLVVGGSGHGRMIADIAEATGEWDRVAFLDAAHPSLTVTGKWRVVGSDKELTQFRGHYRYAVIAIGNNRDRLRLQQEAEVVGFEVVNIVHPTAVIGSQVELDRGCVICAQAVVNCGSKLGKACIINTSASIDHDCHLGDGVHLSPGVHLAGGVTIGECSWVGIGASVIQEIEVGSNAVVGAGATVIRDVRENTKVVGVPAKELK